MTNQGNRKNYVIEKRNAWRDSAGCHMDIRREYAPTPLSAANYLYFFVLDEKIDSEYLVYVETKKGGYSRTFVRIVPTSYGFRVDFVCPAMEMTEGHDNKSDIEALALQIVKWIGGPVSKEEK